MKKTYIYKSLKFTLIILGSYWATRNLLYFIEVWKSLHEQGFATSYLFVSTLIGSTFLVLILFVLPFFPLFVINPEDKILKTLIKSVGYGLFGVISSGGLTLLWFILIGWIHG